jgi:hypothetical protein
MEKIIGLVPNEENVTVIRNELKSVGLGGCNLREIQKPDEVRDCLEGCQKSRLLSKDIAVGAILGLALGVIYGFTSGYLNCTLMDCPIQKSAVFLALIVLFCGFVGGFFGTLVGFGDMERFLSSYVDGVRQGQTFIIAEVIRKSVPEVEMIMKRANGTAIQVIL